MLRIGLTGGIGSGKSTVAELFKHRGAPVIDADEISHSLLEPGQATFKNVVKLFGEEILSDNKSINRNKLRDLVFSDINNRKKLENIIHPEVYNNIVTEVNKLQADYCIIVVPLLVEAGFLDLADRVLVIDADEPVRIKRIAKRNGMSEQEIGKIIKSQSSPQEKLKIADDIINNNGDKNLLV
ncbi:MAG: dephospho-CoA kinase, partial [Acidiferrobacterales bacterium]